MKKKILTTSLAALLFTSNAFALTATFLDVAWNSSTVPAGQQCLKFGGQTPATPVLLVNSIPDGADTIVLEYSDRDSEKMNHGGHGRMSFDLGSTSTSVIIPSISGHTFEISTKFTIIEAHRNPGWDKAGAYMPPCSGGKGHAYYITVKAMDEDKVVAETIVEMGKF